MDTLNLCLEMPENDAKVVSLIRSPCPEKTSKMRSNFADFGKRQNSPIFGLVLDVFSQLGGPIELIPFALGQASPDTYYS